MQEAHTPVSVSMYELGSGQMQVLLLVWKANVAIQAHWLDVFTEPVPFLPISVLHWKHFPLISIIELGGQRHALADGFQTKLCLHSQVL